jgi:hypothetical protein
MPIVPASPQLTRELLARTPISVRRTRLGKWGVYSGNILLEGGFFYQTSAETVADDYRREREALHPEAFQE